IASLCRIAMVCQSARWYVGASGSRGAYGDFLVLHELEVHDMTRGLYAEALDVVGTQVPQEWQRGHIFDSGYDNFKRGGMYLCNQVLHACLVGFAVYQIACQAGVKGDEGRCNFADDLERRQCAAEVADHQANSQFLQAAAEVACLPGQRIQGDLADIDQQPFGCQAAGVQLVAQPGQEGAAEQRAFSGVDDQLLGGQRIAQCVERDAGHDTV